MLFIVTVILSTVCIPLIQRKTQIDKQNKTEKIYTTHRIHYQNTLFFTGIIQAQSTQQVLSPVNGEISALYKEDGAAVKKGDVILGIKSPCFLNALQKKLQLYYIKKNAFLLKKKQYKSNIYLKKKGYISEETFFTEKQAYQVQSLNFLQEKEKLKHFFDLINEAFPPQKTVKTGFSKNFLKTQRIQIKAPADGKIFFPFLGTDTAEIHLLEKGTIIKENQFLFSVNDLSRICTNIKVDDNDKMYLKLGLAVRIQLTANPQQQIDGKILQISQQAFNEGENNPVFLVKICAPLQSTEAKKAFLPGRAINLCIQGPMHTGFALPLTALHFKQEKSFVLTKNPHTKNLDRQVVHIKKIQGNTIIVDHLKEGMEVF